VEKIKKKFFGNLGIKKIIYIFALLNKNNTL